MPRPIQRAVGRFGFRLGVLLVLGLVQTSAAAGDGPLFPGRHYAAGWMPWSIATGDLNGDQVPDLAVANAASDNVSVLLGLGDGTFASAVSYDAGEWPQSVAIGDLDGDEVPDLVVANAGSYPDFGGSVSVLLGLGDGIFATVVHYTAGHSPVSVAIGDLDGDQVPDLAVANYGSGNVSVLLGVGDGTFATTGYYAAGGGGSRSVAIGDLDGDQVPDLALANESGGSVLVLLGVGDGTFAAAVGYAGGNAPYSVAIGDLDGDQMADLAVAGTGTGGLGAAEPEAHTRRYRP